MATVGTAATSGQIKPEVKTWPAATATEMAAEARRLAPQRRAETAVLVAVPATPAPTRARAQTAVDVAALVATQDAREVEAATTGAASLVEPTSEGTAIEVGVVATAAHQALRHRSSGRKTSCVAGIFATSLSCCLRSLIWAVVIQRIGFVLNS